MGDSVAADVVHQIGEAHVGLRDRGVDGDGASEQLLGLGLCVAVGQGHAQVDHGLDVIRLQRQRFPERRFGRGRLAGHGHGVAEIEAEFGGSRRMGNGLDQHRHGAFGVARGFEQHGEVIVRAEVPGPEGDDALIGLQRLLGAAGVALGIGQIEQNLGLARRGVGGFNQHVNGFVSAALGQQRGAKGIQIDRVCPIAFNRAANQVLGVGEPAIFLGDDGEQIQRIAVAGIGREDGARLSARAPAIARLIGADGGMVRLSDRSRAARGVALLLSVHHDSVQPHFLQTWDYGGAQRLFSDRYAGYSLFISGKNPRQAQSLACASGIGAALQSGGFAHSPHHAERIAGEMKPYADRRNGVHYYDNLVVLKTAQQAALLIEAGVIVNRDEELRVADPAQRRAFARAVAAGVRSCLPRPASALQSGFDRGAD